MINTFDLDGVIFLRKGLMGVRPFPNDVIITGRSFEEMDETLEMLDNFGISNQIFFNPIAFQDKTRESSGHHKATVLGQLGFDVCIHFEDDPIQAEIIRNRCPWVTVILLDHNFTEKENVKHDDWN